MPEAVLAISAAAAVAAAGWKLGALDRDGAIAATAVGGCVLGFGGWGPAVLLVLFFVSASGLSALPGGKGPKSRGHRNARQVLANGSAAALAAVATGAWNGWALALAGALAAATADTWATEIGVRSGATPRSILTLEPRRAGTSGAVSWPGTLASAAGAAAIGAVSAWLIPEIGIAGGAAVAAAGVAGSLVDSLLGASLQAVYRCPACGATPEVSNHLGCPARARRTAGVPGLDNDAVNWLATVVGALGTWGLGRL
ncbi:MAG: DUF92 domain-containing protein [Gemmatimonadetes bacterium]|uniref:DUF92 domain-containing protein n=1 Tax=Candidatus Kutchimonas denitrificans TaxID=3056748 RepID=A0AAE4ZC30_9BACT|nr:DUF92 domain-containing protein [Gemmatimonadota bacterium]NIR74770.1 DUF92 domain-containing protein [Candidatus Kutchimonas denitrificans]NIS01520.1 DUF92 domain-containing protein [Gemmatimonadota bacterium]NIT67261.1 DUF92 domain-containing protein [Gemmatimonadota bacterium]NIU52435.1 DUF92 domain-containing protein [Gemmatimonadota bacterium]